jgi:hypothetical protein
MRENAAREPNAMTDDLGRKGEAAVSRESSVHQRIEYQVARFAGYLDNTVRATP